MGTTLSVITLVLALLFIAVEAGLGALRGMKKELCRVGSLFAIGLLLFFLVPGLAEALILASMKLIYPNSNSFSDVAGILATDMHLNVEGIGTVIETILALVASVMVPFVFVVLFWVCKLISWPIFALACLIIKSIRKPQPANAAPNQPVMQGVPAYVNEEAAVTAERPVIGGGVTNRVKPDRTGRLIGAAIGAVAGLFLGALTFMPLAQLSKSVELVGKDAITRVADSETADIVCFWSDSPAGTLYRVTQLDDLFGLLHNSLARIEIDGRAYEAKSLAEVLELVPDVLALADALDGADIGSLASAAEPLKAVVGGVLDIGLFDENQKMELVRYLAKEGLAGTAEDNKLAGVVADKLEEMQFTDIRDDVIAAIDLIVVLDKYGLTNIDQLDAVAEVFEDEAFISESADAVYALNLAEVLLPTSVDLLLETVLEDTEVEVEPVGEIEDFGETKEDFKELLQVAGMLLNPEALTGSVEDMSGLVNGIMSLKESPFISDKTFAGVESMILGQVFTRDNIQSLVDDVVGQNLEEIRKSSKEEIDDETVDKAKETVVEYLTENNEVKLEDLSKVITKLEDGSLMENIDDADVIEEIKNGSFDLNRWLED